MFVVNLPARSRILALVDRAVRGQLTADTVRRFCSARWTLPALPSWPARAITVIQNSTNVERGHANGVYERTSKVQIVNTLKFVFRVHGRAFLWKSRQKQ